MKKNPTNPHTRDEVAEDRSSPTPIQKAKVIGVDDHPVNDGFHTVEVRVYGGSNSQTFRAPVITPHKGDVTIPERGDDVAVIFGKNDKPWIIGFWYALDRARDEDETLNIPDYKEGDRRIGNGSGSHVKMADSGEIEIKTGDIKDPIDIDFQTATAKMSSVQDVPGDDTFYKLEFDTLQSEVDYGIFDPTNYNSTAVADGFHQIHAVISVPNPGQNNKYELSIFKNGSEIRRYTKQSANNIEMSIRVMTHENLNEGDTIDVRLRQNSGSSKTVSSGVTSEFGIDRRGI